MRFVSLAPFLAAAGIALGAEPAASDPEARARAFAIEGLGYDMLWVEPGRFAMGSDPSEPLRDKAEGPRTLVTLTRGYWLGRVEVTQAVYAAVVGENPSRFQEAGRDAPVERVSWEDAMAFCQRLSKREAAAGRLPEGYRYSLPTEAQWERACRAGGDGAYAGEPLESAWFDENSGGATHPVASLAPNAWGFHDMQGNVLEWCLDWYGPYPGGSAVDPRGPARGHFRIARGGSWRAGVGVLRSAARAGGSPGRRDYTLGFRLALVAADE